MPSLIVLGLLAAALSVRSPEQDPDGKALYDMHCKKCHGATGRPSAAMKKLIPELPLWDAAFFAQRTDDAIVRVLANGSGKNMKPFKDLLTPQEMLAIARYIRTLTP